MSKRAIRSLSRGMLALALLGWGLAAPLDRSAALAQEVSEPPSDAPPAPDSVAKTGDPNGIVFTLEDAGKEATQYAREEGSDNRSRWTRTRYERDRETGSSRLGPNVIETRAWVARDVDAAKAIFAEQAAIKDFPERTREEGVTGLNDRFTKYDNVAEETFAIGGYWEDEKIWQHYRVVVRKGQNVAVMYLFGREDLFVDKDKQNNGLVDWFTRKLAGRL